jgi:hypothetical protein
LVARTSFAVRRRESAVVAGALVIAFVAKRKFAPARKNSRQVLARGRRFS